VSHTFENIHHTFSGFPYKILYPKEFYPLANAKQQALTEEFISILEDFLGTKRTPFSFADEWHKNPPKGARGMPLLKYTEKARSLVHFFLPLLNDRTECVLGIMLRLLS
jgi:hypothetical protein